jgi:hypothetical protein
MNYGNLKMGWILDDRNSLLSVIKILCQNKRVFIFLRSRHWYIFIGKTLGLLRFPFEGKGRRQRMKKCRRRKDKISLVNYWRWAMGTHCFSLLEKFLMNLSFFFFVFFTRRSLWDHSDKWTRASCTLRYGAATVAPPCWLHGHTCPHPHLGQTFLWSCLALPGVAFVLANGTVANSVERRELCYCLCTEDQPL